MKTYTVLFAPEAVEQLEALQQYIAEHASAFTAMRFTEAIVATCEGLARFPLRGVPRGDIRPGLRLTHHDGRTIIAYAVDEGECRVSIVGVFHGGQNHESVLSADKRK